MGPETDVLTPPGPSINVDADPREAPSRHRRDSGHVLANDHNLRATDWLFRSRAASAIWLFVRLGWAIGGSTPATRRSGAARRRPFGSVAGRALRASPPPASSAQPRARAAPATAGGPPFLHDFVVPNASWIAKFIALGEIAIGIMLILGPLHRAGRACAGSCSTSSTCSPARPASTRPTRPSSSLVLAWRNAGYLGLDRYAIDAAWWKRHFSGFSLGAGHRRATVTLPVPTP